MDDELGVYAPEANRLNGVNNSKEKTVGRYNFLIIKILSNSANETIMLGT